MEPAIKLVNVSKRFGDAAVLDSVGFEVQKGKVVSVVGPSGAGKTTLLRCIAGLTSIDNGQIVLNGENAITDSNWEGNSAFRGKIGYVFQDLHLWPHKTVLENISFAPAKAKKLSNEKAAIKAMELLEKFDLKHKADHYPASLSGGQKQRVAIARALAMEPDVILMDEITSALDPELIASLGKIVRALASAGIAVVVVTHDMNFASDVSDEMVFIENGQIVERGPADQLFLNPEKARTTEFLKAALDAKE